MKTEKEILIVCYDCKKEINPADGYYAFPVPRCQSCGDEAHSRLDGGFIL